VPPALTCAQAARPLRGQSRLYTRRWWNFPPPLAREALKQGAMTPLSTINLLRSLFLAFSLFVGVMVGEVMGSQLEGAAAGMAFGLCVILGDSLLRGITLRVFSSATLGLLIGFLFTQLLLASDLLHYQSDDWRWVTSLALYAAFGYLGMMLAIRGNRDEFALIIPYVRFRQQTVQDAPLLLDTNIIIDGRISEICASGFLSGSLIVPRFVLAELQRLADSAEPLKRERGRRGLDTLSEMQLNRRLNVTIHETDHDDGIPVDTRLVQLARPLQARLLTNDTALCKIGRLQNVPVLNLNDLARAMAPAISNGDEMELVLVKEGRDAHQAVGYLGDGTMVVVNHARPQLGHAVSVKIVSTLQTAAGRMYFAEMNSHGSRDEKGGSKAAPISR
jgi:uncharacterized protein YacL